MENIANLQSQAGSPDAQPKKRATKRRFNRLSPDELTGVPGANLNVQKTVDTGLSYYFEISIPLGSQVGSAAELGQATDFLLQLQNVCEMNAVGSVISVNILDKKYQITIKIQTVGEPSSNAAPLNFLFEKLNSFFTNARLISNLKPKWKFKVMGTTIGNGEWGAANE